MTDEWSATAGASERAHHAGGHAPAAPRKRRMSAQRKTSAQRPALLKGLLFTSQSKPSGKTF